MLENESPKYLPVTLHLQNIIPKVDQHDGDHEEDDPGVHVDQVEVPQLNSYLWVTVSRHQRGKPCSAELMKADFETVDVVAEFWVVIEEQ